MEKESLFSSLIQLLALISPKLRGGFAITGIMVILVSILSMLLAIDTTGKFIVTVESERDGTPISNARVLIQPSNGTIIPAGFTDQTGKAIFDLNKSLIGDIIVINVTIDGYDSTTMNHILSTTNQTYPIRLKPSP